MYYPYISMFFYP